MQTYNCAPGVMKITTTTFSLLLLFASHSYAQTCDFTPYIRYERTGIDSESVFALAIEVSTNQIRRASLNEDKSVEFSAIPQGNYLMILRTPGFQTTVQNVFVDCDGTETGRRVVSTSYMCSGRETDLRVQETSNAKVLAPDRFTAVGTASFVCSGQSQFPQSSNAQDVNPKTPVPKQISGGVLNSKALSLPRPPYPPAARAVRAEGPVTVQVLIDEEGRVISATALTGHPLLRAAAASAAREAKFGPTRLAGTPVKVSGVITYNFVPPPQPEK